MNLFIIAGEVSGDIHGANLLKALHSNSVQLNSAGIGGDRMKAEGQEQIFHIRQMAFLGIGEILRHLPFIRNVFKTILREIKKRKPDAVVLIDYPGFNLRLAKKLKKLGVPVIYYISPQLWAWGKRRVKIVRNCVDKMLVIFPFEVDFYRDYAIEATYVGHPLMDRVQGQSRPKSGISAPRKLGLMPGSRQHELEMLLPDMLGAADILFEKDLIDEVMIAAVDNLPNELYDKCIDGRGFVQLHHGDAAGFYNQLDLALVKSGTSTLEAACFQVPFVIAYRVSPLTWMLGNLLVKLETIGLANIVAGRPVAQELLQNDFTPQTAAAELETLLEPGQNENKRKELSIVPQKLGEAGASARAADEIIKFIGSEKATRERKTE